MYNVNTIFLSILLLDQHISSHLNYSLMLKKKICRQAVIPKYVGKMYYKLYIIYIYLYIHNINFIAAQLRRQFILMYLKNIKIYLRVLYLVISGRFDLLQSTLLINSYLISIFSYSYNITQHRYKIVYLNHCRVISRVLHMFNHMRNIYYILYAMQYIYSG